MDITSLATSFGARLPEWVGEEIADDPTHLATDEDRMRLAHRLAERNHRENTGGPFAALVVDGGTGEIISVGVNVVLASGLSSTHAEVVALSLAQTRLGTWDLAGTSHAPVELVVNWRPCVMCYGATMWAGIERLVIAGEGEDVEFLTGFDEGPMREDWQQQFADRGIEVVTDVLRDGAIETFRNYGARADTVVYNGRR
jgi:tRNA(Arg) A34 adenosine deaminase TadA